MSRIKLWRLALPLVLIASLLVGMTPAALAAPPLAKVKSTVYIVQMIQDPVVAYSGGIQGLQPTKPGKGQKINPNSAHVKRYVAHLDAQHNQALSAVGASEKLYDYRYTFNGFAAKMTSAQAAALKTRPDVVRVWADEIRQLQTDNTPGFLGLTEPGTGLWAQNYKGEDVVIGVIDTGIWPEHPSFSDQEDLVYRTGNSGKRLRVYDAPQDWYGGCQSGEQFSQSACGYKLIGARYFKEGFSNFEINFSGDYLSPRDADGHGTHTASTAGGNANVPAAIFGVPKGNVSGIAPRARIAAYKGCWADAGCALSDLAVAIDTAVADGVDVINYSIGSSSTTLTGPDDIAFLFAAYAGVYVATSAGNSGPGDFTVGSPAIAPWVTAVGANSHSRLFLSDISVYDTNHEPVVMGTPVWGGSVTPGVSNYRLVDAAAVAGGTNAMCLEPFAPGTFAPTDAVLCNQYDFGVARIVRGENVAAGGGGAVLFHNAPTVNVMPTDNHVLPTVHMLNDVGQPVKDLLVNNPGAQFLISFNAGTAVYSPDPRVKAPVMASFSSRGPNGGALDIIKPDITAPGLSILAGNTPTPFLGAPGQLFQAIQGTSMSSPHIAGVGALIVGAHPEWTPAQVRSAMMTTAYQQVYVGDGSELGTPFDIGAGHVAPNKTLNPGLVYDADIWDYVAFMCGSVPYWNAATCALGTSRGGSLEPSDLNLPSIGIAELAGVQTIARTVTNVGAAGTYNVNVVNPPGIEVSVEPAMLMLTAGQVYTYQVTFTTQNDALLDEWAFGSLTWSDGSHSVYSPLAVRPVAISAPAEIYGTGIEGSQPFEVVFGYNGEYAPQVLGLVEAIPQNNVVIDDPANDIAVALASGVGLTWHTVTVPANSAHLRISLFDEYTDGEDDLDLYVWGPDVATPTLENLLNLSGSTTSAEEVNVAAPAPGEYKIAVHGWQTDGPDANYSLFVWEVSNTPLATPHMTVNDPGNAAVGATAEITVAWSGLNADAKYMGAVSHTGIGGAQVGLTLVRIDTDVAAASIAGTANLSQGETKIFLPALDR